MSEKLTEPAIVENIKAKFADLALEWPEVENGGRYLVVPADKVDAIAAHLKGDPALSFDYLMNVSAFDASKLGENFQHIEVTYHFYSYRHRHAFTLKARVPRSGGRVKTLSHLYGCADFQEREVFDHFGVAFDGHPDLRRILLPDDWVGHPLLKDYQEQEEYNGIGTTRPSLL